MGSLRASLSALCALTLGVLPACADDVTSADGNADEADTTEDTGEVEAQLGGPAQGITIVSLEANQGTAVEIFADGGWLGPNDRNAFLIRDRDTLIRVKHVIDDPQAWIPRNITAFLHVVLPGGEEVVRERTFFVDADSDARDLDTQFFFGVLAAEALPGTKVWIELRESDDRIDVSTLGEGLATIDDPGPIGFEDIEMNMKVVLVPVRYEHFDPPTLVELSEAEMQLFHDQMLQQNPLQTIDIQVRDEPLVRSQQLTNLGDLLGPTRQLRIQDGAEPNVYYHALIDVRGGGVNMVAGIAWLTGPSMDEGNSRVAATVFHRPSSPPDEEGGEPTFHPPTQSARTWVHEVGHNQGLSHVACPNGGAAGPDPGYPYADGKIGVYGFGIRDFHIYTPTGSHDYMSYCGNSWVSDWTWNKTYERIRTLTSWDNAGAVPDPVRGPTLVGFLFADGSERWWAYEDDVVPRQSLGAQQIEFWSGDALLASEYAHVASLSDGQGLVVTVPMPAVAPGAISDIVHVDEHGSRRAVTLSAVEGKASRLAGR